MIDSRKRKSIADGEIGQVTASKRNKQELRDPNARKTTASDRPTSLMDLPAEIRNRIFEYAVTSDSQPIDISVGNYAGPALLRVSPQIREEAMGPFLYNNRYRADSNADYLRWAAVIGEEMLIRHGVHFRWKILNYYYYSGGRFLEEEHEDESS